MEATSEGHAFDPLKVEVFHHLFAAAAEEMGVSLQRSAFSVNIKERLDFSCAIFTADGTMAAQAAHLPVHLGATPLSVAAAIAQHRLRPGDVVFLNDPFMGGTHLPDITSVEGVFSPAGGDEPLFYCVSRAHHADVGGAFPGSMAPARDVHGEGLRLPPIRLVRGGAIDEDLLDVFLANVRVPSERRADLFAQLAASRAGVQRMEAMMAEHGAAELVDRAQDLVAWTASLVRERIAGLKTGTWRFEDVLEGGADGQGDLLPLRVAIESDGAGLRFDFRESAPQAMDGAPVNTTRAVTVSAVFYALRLLLPEGTPTNAGVLDRVEILTTPGTIVDAAYPAPVAAGNVETSQRLVDVILGALGQLLPGEIPAASAGTMNNLSFGGTTASGRAFTHYETHGGGAGAGPRSPGAHAVQTHMTNTRNTPIEALETEMPVRIVSQTVRRGSGGDGARRGGDGILRRVRFLVDVRLAWMGERQRQAPYGALGGRRGSLGTASVQWPAEDGNPDQPGETRTLDPKAAIDLPAGAEFELRSPGGGGHGDVPSV